MSSTTILQASLECGGSPPLFAGSEVTGRTESGGEPRPSNRLAYSVLQEG
jgi:hypothetical protein